MTQPKAKWSKYEDDLRVWTAAVGCFYLEVDGANGRCEISEWEDSSGSIGEDIWIHHAPTPVDVVELMSLTEAELSRRLMATAETMAGAELVPVPDVPEPSVWVIDDVIPCRSPDEESLSFRSWMAEKIRSKHTSETPFHVGECLIHFMSSTECGCFQAPPAQPPIERVETQTGPVFVRSGHHPVGSREWAIAKISAGYEVADSTDDVWCAGLRDTLIRRTVMGNRVVYGALPNYLVTGWHIPEKR